MEGTLYRIIRLARYRFLLIAGLLPYVLGAGVAFYYVKRFDFFLFATGLIGLLFVLIGVEAFNEYFDWRLGTDRVFQLNPVPVTKKKFVFGLGAFFVAFIVAVFLTLELGVAIIILAGIGFFCAFSYLGPPLKFAYRGLGELIIALAYGPFMVMGSYYVQSQRIDPLPLLASVFPALLLYEIAILNEVPDYFQDRIVGKRNICVRIGQKNVVKLYGMIQALFYIVLFAGLFWGKLPRLAWLVLICLPIFTISYNTGMKTYENPRQFTSAIKYMMIHYLLVLCILITGYTLHI